MFVLASYLALHSNFGSNCLVVQIEMVYKLVAHMAANDRVLLAEGNCGSPRSIKAFLGECNVDE